MTADTTYCCIEEKTKNQAVVEYMRYLVTLMQNFRKKGTQMKILGTTYFVWKNERATKSASKMNRLC